MSDENPKDPVEGGSKGKPQSKAPPGTPVGALAGYKLPKKGKAPVRERRESTASDAESTGYADVEDRMAKLENMLSQFMDNSGYQPRDHEDSGSPPRREEQPHDGSFAPFMPPVPGEQATPKPTERKRKRDKSCTKGYSDTDSGDESMKWELEDPTTRAERYEAMRVATIAPTNNNKAKAVREQQKSLFKPILSMEELINAVKKLDVPDKRGIIHRARAARKTLAGRWTKLQIAEKHSFEVVELFKQQKATGDDKSLAAALEKIEKRRSYSAPKEGGHKGGFRGGRQYSSSAYRNCSPRRSPSPRRARGRSPRRSPPRGGSSNNYYNNNYSGGRGRSDKRYGTAGNCNYCGRAGHYVRNCPEIPQRP